MKKKVRIILMYIENFFAVCTILFTVGLCALLLIRGGDEGATIVLAYSLSWVPILGLNISVLILHSKRIRKLKGLPSLKERFAFYKTKEGKEQILREFGFEKKEVSKHAKYNNPES